MSQKLEVNLNLCLLLSRDALDHWGLEGWGK